jgi:hypothetical protein
MGNAPPMSRPHNYMGIDRSIKYSYRTEHSIQPPNTWLSSSNFFIFNIYFESCWQELMEIRM